MMWSRFERVRDHVLETDGCTCVKRFVHSRQFSVRRGVTAGRYPERAMPSRWVAVLAGVILVRLLWGA